MNLKNLTLIGAALLMSAPVFGSTYFGGVEDRKGFDYDYNDLVFSISGDGLTLNSTGKFYDKPVINNNGYPFWDNLSYDAPAASNNIGFCIYGGGACNGGKALDADAKYLASATSPAMSANDVTFSVNGKVNASVSLSVAADNVQLGYYLASDPSNSHLLGKVGNTYTFTPGGDFGLYSWDATTGNVWFSQTNLGALCDDQSHFAFFTAAPEPGMTSLVGAGLLAVGAFLRRKKVGQN